MSTIANNTVFPADSREAGDFSGLTKREYFAVMAMRAICANSTFISAICDLANKNNTHTEKLVAISSVELAKALIAELNKKTRTPQDVVQLLEREIEGLEFGEPVKLYALQLAANTIQELVEKLKKYEGNEEEK